jgi:hypothetical protein
MDVKGKELESVNWNHVVQGRDLWQAAVIMVM